MEGRANFYRFARGQRQTLVNPEVHQLIGYGLLIFFGMAQTEARNSRCESLPLMQLKRVLEMFNVRGLHAQHRHTHACHMLEKHIV
jgi:hypothetical protein